MFQIYGTFLKALHLKAPMLFMVLTLPITAAFAQVGPLTVTPTSLSFTVQADSATLPPAQITSNTGDKVDFTSLGVFDSFGTPAGFLDFTPYSGSTPAKVTISLDARGLSLLSPRIYSGVYTAVFATGNPPTNTYVVAIKLTLTPPPPPIVTMITNAATFQPDAVAPYEIVSIFGSNLGLLYDMTTTVFIGGRTLKLFPTNSGSTMVTFHGIAAPILFAAKNQINVVVPAGVANMGTADVAVTHYSQTSDPLRVNVSDSSPGILTFNQTGNGPGVIFNTGDTFNSAANPAPKGSIIQMYGTGGGLFDQRVPDGWIYRDSPPYPAPVLPVSVSIGGKNAPITYAGAAPLYVFGLLQINAMVPLDADSGTQPVVVTIGNNKNNKNLTMVVQ